MPRVARVKEEVGIYHIMIRSISEVDLFSDREDKLKYLSLIKKYQNKYQFKVYAYCLMNNHGHLMLDCNGADISRIMHSINFCYAQYYNRKYGRHGHLFQDRFKSKIIKDERYLITLSAYIHNNPKDIPMYKDSVEDYEFSSLREYLYGTNTFEILEIGFLSEILNLRDNKRTYLGLVKKCSCEDEDLDIEFTNKEHEYRDERRIIPRNHHPEKVINYVADYLNIDKDLVGVKYKRKYIKIRAISCFLMSCYCNVSQKDICKLIGNITQTRVSKLSIIGMNLVFEDKKLLDGFLKTS